MMKYTQINRNNTKSASHGPAYWQTGDTIVEVLIAIAIAAFAIGISYATAQRSLQQAIAARERNESLNIMQNQLSALKLRYQKSPPGSFGQFTYPTSKHFCLDDTAYDPNASNWGVYLNDGPNGPPAQNAPLAIKADSGPYDNTCQKQKTGEGATYYVDISTQTSSANPNPTIYQVSIRWERLGGGQVNQASIYYRF